MDLEPVRIREDLDLARGVGMGDDRVGRSQIDAYDRISHV
jgi:hypothetical protein